jgi:anti-sigma regulatory factor (Ser/Thr protein kinase)
MGGIPAGPDLAGVDDGLRLRVDSEYWVQMVEMRVDLPAELASVRAAPGFVAGLSGLAADLLTDVELVVSELVTNALVHDSLGEGDVVKLAIRREDAYLRVEVEDRGDFTKRLGANYAPGGTGLGLRIVDELCDRWEAASGRVTAWSRI